MRATRAGESNNSGCVVFGRSSTFRFRWTGGGVEYSALIILDDLLHVVVEKNPDTSLRKFVRYNASILLRHIMKMKSCARQNFMEKNSITLLNVLKLFI